MLFGINLMDRDRASFPRTLEALQKKCGREVTPVQVPIGEEADFKGVVDLISGKAFTWESDESGTPTEIDIPGDLADEVASAREALMEMVAEQDEDLMDAYLEAGELDIETFIGGLKKAVASRSLFPVFAVSGGKNIGVQPLMDALVDLVPAPDWRTHDRQGRRRGAGALGIADSPFAAYVFKTISDPYTGRISLMRIFSGGIESDANVTNPAKRSPERLGALSVIQGKELEHVDGARSWRSGRCAQTQEHPDRRHPLCVPKEEIVIEPVAIPEAAISFALEPASKGDEDKLAAALAKIRDEDPTVSFGRDPQTKEQLISGTGQLHVEVVVGKLKKRFGVDVILHQPKVPYRETITGSAESTTRHKKQTGGSGQFAECKILMEPNLGKGYEFIDKIFGGSISQGYRPAVDKGIQEAAEKGVIAGYPMVDFKITLLDGKEHAVDSSEMAFKAAGRKAFKDCASRCKPTMLEPIMQVEVYTPRRRHGRCHGRPQLAARPGSGHGFRRRHHHGQGHGAPRRVADLRPDPAVHHRWSRRLPHGV